MATADARLAYEKNGKKGVFVHVPTKTTYYPEIVFKNNPYIERHPKSVDDVNLLDNIPKNRPYAKDGPNGELVIDNSFKAVPGDLFLTEDEMAWVPEIGPYILVEPNVKQTFLFGQNKDWGFEKWQMLVNETDLPWVQAVYPGAKLLKGARHIQADIRQGFALMSRARLFAGTDGAMHHAAAALRTPAVVIWGHFSSPRVLGYESHINIWKRTGPCWSFGSICMECKRTMRGISVSEVKSVILSAWSRLSKDEESSLKPSPKEAQPA